MFARPFISTSTLPARDTRRLRLGAALGTSVLVLAACGGGDSATEVASPTAGPTAHPTAATSCGSRTNNNIDKLLECVTLEGVRAHQAAFQAIADANAAFATRAARAMTRASPT